MAYQNGHYPQAQVVPDRQTNSFWANLRQQRGSKVVAISQTDGFTTETEIYHRNAAITTLLALVGLVLVLAGLAGCFFYVYLRV